MDNFAEILFFILFIIISLLSGRKKKSKSKSNKKSTLNKNQDVGYKKKVTQSSNRSNILEELLGIKLPEQEPQKPEVPDYTPSNEYVAYNKLSKEDEEKYEIENADGVSDYYNVENNEKNELESEKEKHRAFKTKTNFTDIEILKNEIHSLIADRSNLQNYIIIQEILNKPKALRK